MTLRLTGGGEPAHTLLVNGLLEEVFYRRWLQTAWERLLGRWPAIVLASLLWAAWHVGVQTAGRLGADLASVAVNQGVLGLFLGYLWSRYRLLWPVLRPRRAQRRSDPAATAPNTAIRGHERDRFPTTRRCHRPENRCDPIHHTGLPHEQFTALVAHATGYERPAGNPRLDSLGALFCDLFGVGTAMALTAQVDHR